ncbi:hypothetical protein PBI_NEBKISS_36 [Mycobacterium phage Nebkiss]|nr:hypothetical protein PBI_NEBKISS_36 [Mycobacterium phage Nebkiss]
MTNWQHYWKAIIAFLTLVATNAATDLMQSGNPWPSTGGEWARWGVSILGGTLLVYGKSNAPKKTDGTITRDEPESPSESLTEPARVSRKRLPVI